MRNVTLKKMVGKLIGPLKQNLIIIFMNNPEDIEDLIVQYVHKKFNRQDNIKKDRDCAFGIKNVLIYPQSRKNYGSYTQASTSNTR